ncbi:MAG: oligosaccharide flippase family protein [Oscillospiraceae bacterium]|nr:oligosaccharide flippase family protein [Oscillospiraceae bacterium]
MKAFLQKLKSMPETLKATLVFAIASFATSGINYITTPIFTRILSKSEYGLISVYNSWYDVIKVVAAMTLIFPGILNVGLYDHSDNRYKYLSSMLGITSVSTLALVVIYAVFFRGINALIGLPPLLMVLMLAMCMFAPATTFWTFKQRYEFRYKITFFVAVGSALLAQILSIAAVLLAKRYTDWNLAVVRLWAAGAVNLIVAAILFIHILKRGGKIVDLPLWKKTFIVAIPLIPHYLGSVALTSTDRIMIERMEGLDKTGIYSLAAILSAIGVLLWRALSVTFTPYINAKLGERDFKAIRENVKPLLVMVGLTCVLVSLAAPEIIRILATDDYLQGVYVVPPIAAGIYIHAMYDNFTAISFFHKNSVGIMIATLIAAATNIVLNYFCIRRFGFIAAGYTTLVSNLVLTGMHYFNARRIEKEKVFSPMFSLLSVVSVTALCLAANLTYGLHWIRWIFFAAVLAAMLLFLPRLIRTISKMKA